MRKWDLILLAGTAFIFHIPAETTETVKPPANGSFLMPVEDVFSVSGRGTFATGIIERGRVNTGDSVEIIGFADTLTKSKVKGILSSNKAVLQAGPGDNISLVLSGVDKSQVRRGMVIVQPGTIKPYIEFSCEIILKKTEGSIIVKPVTSDSRRQFYFRNVDISGVINLHSVKELQPGGAATATILLVHPVALEKDLHFDLRESGKTIGYGKVTALLK